VGYGQYLNQNLLYLLENFASNTAPLSTNLQGQLWFNKSNQSLQVFTNQGFKSVSGVTNAGIQPSVAKDGDVWFNTGTRQTYLYDSGAFHLVGPLYTRAQGPSGAFPVDLQDSFAVGVTHNIVQLQFNGQVYATISKDPSFIPTAPPTGFTTINPGITLSSLIANPTFNSNVVGSVTGNLYGDVFGNVRATTITGTLTGNVVGSVTGTVVNATELRGQLYGNIESSTGLIVDFLTSNASITGGFISGIRNITSETGNFTILISTDISATNIDTGNLYATGGTLNGLSYVGTGTLQASNFSSGNVLITGGSLSSLSSVTATTAQATNFSSPNTVITGGSVTGLSTIVAGTGFNTNFSTGNAVITGGSATGLSSVVASSISGTEVAATTLTATNGSVTNLTGANVILTTANIIAGNATTKTYSDNSPSIATTAFVQSVLPGGAIIMWYGSTGNIPTGWKLCDGKTWGTYTTPDLRGRFITGASDPADPPTQTNNYLNHTTGGANGVLLTTDNLPAHSHSISAVTGNTSSAGAHTHSASSTSSVSDSGHSHALYTNAGAPWNGVPRGVSANSTGTDGDLDGSVRVTGYDKMSVDLHISPATTGIGVATSTTLASAGTHMHTVTFSGNTGNTGSNTVIDIRPSYYALCYIMKIY